MTRLNLNEKRFSAVVALAFLFGFAVLGFLFNNALLGGYIQLDKVDLDDNAARVQRILDERRLDLEAKNSDWGAWDEAFQYIKHENDSFENKNLTENVFMGMRISVIAYLDDELRVISAKQFSTKVGKIVDVPKEDLTFLYKGSELISRSEQSTYSGLIRFKGEPAIIAAKKVSKGDGSGPPTGRVVFIRLLDEDLLASLSKQALLDVRFEEDNGFDFPSKQTPHSFAFPDGEMRMFDDYAHALIGLRDLSGDRIGHLQVKIDRTIMRIGRENAMNFLLLYGFLAFAITACAIFLLNRAESKRVLARTIAESKGIRESQLQTLALIDSIPGYVSWYDRSLRFLGVNRKLAADLNLRAEDFDGKDCDFLPQGFNFKQILQDFFNDETSQSKQLEVFVDGEGENKRKFNISMEKYFNNQRVIVVGIDLTHSWLLEQQSLKDRQAAINAVRLSSLGQMAGGIAHEINNPLAIIQGVCERMDKKIKSGSTEDLAKMAAIISKTTKRIALIIAGLKLVARDGSTDPIGEVAVKTILDDTHGLCAEKFKNSGIHLFVSDVSADVTLPCRSAQIGQVLINLLNNSFDAVAGLEARWVRIDVADSPTQLEISVSDSGKGIVPEVAEKIMDPFFTTKPIGKGTGLGLSVSKAIIESHGGELYLDPSSPNTRFVIKFMKVEEHVEALGSAA